MSVCRISVRVACLCGYACMVCLRSSVAYGVLWRHSVVYLYVSVIPFGLDYLLCVRYMPFLLCISFRVRLCVCVFRMGVCLYVCPSVFFGSGI